MKTRMFPTIAAFLFAITLSGAPPALEHKPLVVFLVRHGEKVELSRDPALSTAGRDRAAVLAKILRSAKIESVHSSDFIRTRDTAAPTAAEHGLKAELYDHRDLPALVDKLRKTGGRHLVVGHSTTTPALVELLGGEAISEINEKGEYDRLYIVTVGRDGTAISVMMRYGKAYDSDQGR